VTKVVAVVNQKGGVGKTTSAINIACALAVAEQRVLLVDGDPQANASAGLGISASNVGRSTYDVLLGDCAFAEALHRQVQFPKLDVLPATADLAGAEVELVSIPQRELRMRLALQSVLDTYDVILIDCPPSLGLITVNMLAAADTLLIPLQCEYFALEGISQLMNTVRLVQRSINESLSVVGVLLTMYDARLNLSRQVAANARAYFGDVVFDVVIPRNVRLAEAPSFGRPIISYDITSAGATSYMTVAKELMSRLETNVSMKSGVA